MVSSDSKPLPEPMLTKMSNGVTRLIEVEIWIWTFFADLKKSDNLLIYQAKINPPHFKVIIGDDTWDLQKVSGCYCVTEMFRSTLIILKLCYPVFIFGNIKI